MAEDQQEKDLSCSICTDLFYQPLTLLDCLHTFCGSCLKEWFTWQATSAAAQRRRTTHPYTCPSCRDVVRAAKADWRMTSQLEDYLKAHPDREKSPTEKEELRTHYKPGDDVLPKVVVLRDDGDSEDERTMAGVRELSLADEPTGRRRRERQTHPQHDSESHQVQHQSSLRDLLVASPVDSHDVQQEILQSIHNEGLLDGIDIDNLTTEQEEELTERIAAAYRRRQRRRDRSGNRENRLPSSRSPQPSVDPGPESRSRHHSRTNSASSLQTRPSAQSHQPQDRAHPPVSRPRLLEQTTQSSRSDRRTPSASNQWNAISGSRAESSPSLAPAARSATDLSERSSTEEGARDRRRRVSTNARSTTDPTDEEMRGHVNRMRATSGTTRQSSVPVRPPGSSSNSADAVRRQTRPSNSSSTSLVTPTNPTPPQQAIRPAPSNAAFAPEHISTLQLDPNTPPIPCSRCEKMDLRFDLHYHCKWCRNGTFNICLGCYRNEQGCDHWFGFGYRAYDRWRQLAPPEGWPADYEGPHVLTARQYLRPDAWTTQPAPASRQAADPGLQEGAFCDMCLTFADDHYWHCQYCLDGAWGYCNPCVLAGKHCTHPLLPIAQLSTLHQPHQDPTTAMRAQVPHLPRDSYAILPVHTDCDICEKPIPPAHTRFHCYKCSQGDYDVCTDCYTSLVAVGKISHANGPKGWRRCLQGHRMAIVGYQDAPGGGLARVTVRGPVGGWRLKEEASTSGASGPVQALPPLDSSLGGRCWARYSRFPLAGVTDELMFPKNAEIREVEERHPEWWIGVYAGTVLLLPTNHVERIAEQQA